MIQSQVRTDPEVPDISNLNTLDLNLVSNFDTTRLREFNNKSVDLIFEGKVETALELLKKLEVFLEANAIEAKLNLDKKILIIILYNLACCYQKLKDYDNCINYLEAVIYHFDSLLEPKHKIKIGEDYFLKSINENQTHYALLGDFILELRFSAKFHLQMCAVLSQAGKHVDALKHARLASLMCEDNLIKTNYIYAQMKDKNFTIKNSVEQEDEIIMFSDKIKQSYKIINELYNRVLKIRGKDNKNKTNYNHHNIDELINNNKSETFNSYLNYRNFEVNKFTSNNILINNIRHIFGSTIKKDDWIQLLNIGNIMFLSPLNYEDLDLESDPKYELLRDAILEKVVMLTVAYFCIATELRYLAADKGNNKTNGEFYHFKAVEFSSLFLPVSCPIVKHYIVSFYKHYGQDMEVIPEGKEVNINIDLLRSEIELDKDTLTFVRTQKINYSYKTVGHRFDDQKAAVANIKNFNNNNLININNNDSNDLSGFNSNNLLNSNEDETDKNLEMLQNLRKSEFAGINYLSINNKSKIKEDKAPKFKLNFNNLDEINKKNNLENNLNNNLQNVQGIQNSKLNKDNLKIKTNTEDNEVKMITNYDNNNSLKQQPNSEFELNKKNKNYISNNSSSNKSANLNNRYMNAGAKTDRPRSNLVQGLRNSNSGKFKDSQKSNNKNNNSSQNLKEANNNNGNYIYNNYINNNFLNNCGKEQKRCNTGKIKGNLTERISRTKSKANPLTSKSKDIIAKGSKTQRNYQKPKFIDNNKMFSNSGNFANFKTNNPGKTSQALTERYLKKDKNSKESRSEKIQNRSNEKIYEKIEKNIEKLNNRMENNYVKPKQNMNNIMKSSILIDKLFGESKKIFPNSNINLSNNQIKNNNSGIQRPLSSKYPNSLQGFGTLVRSMKSGKVAKNNFTKFGASFKKNTNKNQ